MADQLGNHGAFEAKEEVACVAEQRHFEEVKTIDVRDGVDPFREAMPIPELPEKPADQRGQAEAVDAPPVAASQFRKKGRVTFQPAEGHQ